MTRGQKVLIKQAREELLSSNEDAALSILDTLMQVPSSSEETFPVLFSDDDIKVYKNQCNEIFVAPIDKKAATIRIDSDGKCLTITAHDGQWSPTSINGLGGFIVSARS